MNGICPNTGKVCEKLMEVSTIRRAHIDASPSPFLPGAWVGLNDTERDVYNRNLQEGIRSLELYAKAEQATCVGACALADVDIPSYICGDSTP